MHEAQSECEGNGLSRVMQPAAAGHALALLGLLLLLMLAPVPADRAQTPGSTIGPAGGQHLYYPGRADSDMSGDYDPIMMERRMNALNNERQKEMVSDTDKLLKLAKELNDEIAAKNTSSLTLDQLHKIAEIEKLARGVKEKMADGTGQMGPAVSAPNIYPPH
jgi:hypothetical protein